MKVTKGKEKVKASKRKFLRQARKQCLGKQGKIGTILNFARHENTAFEYVP